ncbi:hypothetical protein NHL50_01255 [Acidimicrobiia bacterium EGI L10123]|uniref:hypothetical protein n=1 Tax=Salinilacustrithrix flava TaxID=2957203 RepID=UPI003D7C2DA2|nr:hypothetical protein [Acidimicrobiia bacterium EGI L10123]
MQTLNLIAGIAFDPTIRGILAVLVGVVVLMGSVYLLLATNTGNRLGFLLALTGFFGWMAIMGSIWWIYGIGMQGQAPEWDVVEYNAGDVEQAVTDKVTELELSDLPQDDDGVDYEAMTTLAEEDPERFAEINEQFEEDSNGWRWMPASDPSRGEAEATVSDALPECSTCNFGIEGPADFLVLGAFEVGGKEGLPADPSRWDRIRTQIVSAFTIKNPERYAVVQVQKVIDQTPEPGQAPPTPEVDPAEPVISVVMIRDIGDRRFPAAMITIGSTLIFALLCWVLHQRERILESNLAHAEAVRNGTAVPSGATA